MTYRPTEFQVNNSGGIECDIFMDPETTQGGTVYWVIQQDADRITVSLECLENLLTCANELLQAMRETRSDARNNTQKNTLELPPFSTMSELAL